MSILPPPPILGSARVLSYAAVDDIPYRKWGTLYVGGVILEKVPRLAICVNLGKDIGPMLYHCDEAWEVLGTSGAATVDEVKARAEQNYPGALSRWVDVNTSAEEAMKYFDEHYGWANCSFCGKRSFEMKGAAHGEGAIICRQCVEDYYRAFQEPDAEEGTP